MSDCKRCRGSFDSMDNEYLNGVHWSCLTYEEQLKIEKERSCEHKEFYKVKICKNCNKQIG